MGGGGVPGPAPAGAGRESTSLWAAWAFTLAAESRSSRPRARDRAADAPKGSFASGAKVRTKERSLSHSARRCPSKSRMERSTASAPRRASSAAVHLSR